MKTKKLFHTGILAFFLLALNACSSIPKTARAVDNFELNRYLGTWYEIARLDFKYEKDLNNTSAQYQLDKDGKVKVLNSGYNYIKQEWTSADGKAKFRDESDVAALKVSFFGPFYSGYNVVALDSDYTYALIAGKNLDYLWILSRTKEIPSSIKAEYLKIATDIGYDTSRLIWVEHNRDDNPFLDEK